MNDKSQLVTVFGELARSLDSGAFFDVLQNLLVAGLVTDNQQPAARFLHGFERLVISGDTRRAGPRQIQWLQLGA